VPIWLVLLVLMCSAAAGDIIHVDASASAGGNGQSWPTAYKYLEDGLAAAGSGDDIWVAEGTYKPDQNSAQPWGTGLREETFQMENGVGMYGGFPNTGNPVWEDRDPNQYETVLSGDLNDDDIPGDLSTNDNSYHVVNGSGTTPSATLDGFTITAGYTNRTFPQNAGGGMYNVSGSPTVTNCTFRGNTAIYEGKDLFPDGRGGGMYNSGGSPIVTNCTFRSNSSDHGGGMFNNNSSPTVTNCTFSGNTVADSGGGMYNSGGSPTVTNCTFSGNTARRDGGGMNNHFCIWTVKNCIFWGNTATEKGQEIAAENSSTVTIHYCDVEGGAAGVYADGSSSINWTGANDYSDPLFVDANGPDNVIGTADDNLRLLADSNCINAGDNTAIAPDTADLDGDGNTAEPTPFDLDGNPRVGQGVVDMGAYEYGSALVDIGLRLYDGVETIAIACEAEGTVTSPLRIAKSGIIYGVELVEPGHPTASGIVIQTGSGAKALAKLE
jgi:hypothetical protein